MRNITDLEQLDMEVADAIKQRKQATRKFINDCFATEEDLQEMRNEIVNDLSLIFDEEDTKQIMENIEDDIESVYKVTRDMDEDEFYIFMSDLL